MKNKSRRITVFWLRRDLRLTDNHGLYRALKSESHVQCVFIFDTGILEKLEDKDDARVTFIHDQLSALQNSLKQHKASLAVYHDSPQRAWEQIIKQFNPQAVYYNHDYEPYARKRDQLIRQLLKEQDIRVHSFKDQVIFEKEEVLKAGNAPYTVFTPYKNAWLRRLPEQNIQTYPSEKLLEQLHQYPEEYIPTLSDLGFKATTQQFPDTIYEQVLGRYQDTRDIPSNEEGTTQLSIHLRFGTLSIRQLVLKAYDTDAHTWLNELIWREFYMMILWHFPQTVNQAFKSAYDRIQWRNNEGEFKAWCQGKTGYPLVDAGMRQLNETGFMHNRVRMVVASFLCKHLLIDWRWGEAYFARKLQDYEQSSNVGNWQWAAGSGNDAAPYFRVFNPELQLKKFDPDFVYIKRWIPELDDPFQYPQPIVEHKKARERALKVYKDALNN